MKIQLWGKQHQNPARRRYRVFTVAWGDGQRPLAGSKKYYKHFLTFGFARKLFGVKREHLGFRLYVLGAEVHYRA